MHRAKLVMSLAAAVITLAGATHLAQPAHAATELLPCTREQRAYADGYADGSCGGSGTVGTCQQSSGGGFYFDWSCDE